jgi:hypothetical protein
MRCPKCQADNPDEARFCNSCASKLPQVLVCPSCGGKNIEGAKFCNFCAKRFDQERTPGKGSSGSPAVPAGAAKPKTAARPIPPPAVDEENPTKKKGGTQSTSFCHVCHEPTPTNLLTFDVDGNHVCRKCMLSGAKPKDAKTRALEALKQQVSGTTATQTSYTGGLKGSGGRPVAMSGGGSRRGSKIALAGILVVLLAGLGVAAWYYFMIYRKQVLDNFGTPASAGTASGGAAASGKPGSASGGPASDPGSGDAASESKGEFRVFEGAFAGTEPGEGETAVTMVFESASKEKVFVTLPAAASGAVKDFVKGNAYRIKFAPDAKFQETRRIDFSTLKGPIKPIGESK